MAGMSRQSGINLAGIAERSLGVHYARRLLAYGLQILNVNLFPLNARPFSKSGPTT